MNLMNKWRLWSRIPYLAIITFYHGLGMDIDTDCLVVEEMHVGKSFAIPSSQVFEFMGYSSFVDKPMTIVFGCPEKTYKCSIHSSRIETGQIVGKKFLRQNLTIAETNINDEWKKMKLDFSQNNLNISSVYDNKTWLAGFPHGCDQVDTVDVADGHFLNNSCANGHPIWKVVGAKQIQIPMKKMGVFGLAFNQTIQPSLILEGKDIPLRQFQDEQKFLIFSVGRDDELIVLLLGKSQQLLIKGLSHRPTHLGIYGRQNDTFNVTQFLLYNFPNEELETGHFQIVDLTESVQVQSNISVSLIKNLSYFNVCALVISIALGIRIIFII